MRNIHPPIGNRAGSLQCADALEPAFAQLLERAALAGWKAPDVQMAVCLLTLQVIGAEASSLLPTSGERQARGPDTETRHSA